ncbi:hypothetical protein HAX54_000695 [Datura stramonium]|uniref:F-box domain-containing protein n=1 Tax=Datura stramonium TaxID=4076 RepID=A0ABS8T283_DATST|nr:hypothetical protein [Datura stramonium]
MVVGLEENLAGSLIKFDLIQWRIEEKNAMDVGGKAATTFMAGKIWLSNQYSVPPWRPKSLNPPLGYCDMLYSRIPNSGLISEADMINCILQYLQWTWYYWASHVVARLVKGRIEAGKSLLGDAEIQKFLSSFPNFSLEAPGICCLLHKSEKRMSCYSPNWLLPEILCRLPIESLLRFRCVSKQWYSLISSPHFVSLYTTVTATSPPLLLLRYISTEPKKQEKYSVYSDPSSKNENLTLVKELKFPFKTISGKHFGTVGFCNGLVFLSHDIYGYKNTFILWNPAIRKKYHLP